MYVGRRHVVLVEVASAVSLLRYLDRVLRSFRKGQEELTHLALRVHVQLVVGHPHTVGLVYFPPGLDAQQHVVDAGLFTAGVVHVVGGDHWQVEIAGKGEQLVVELGQFGGVVVL